ncbi:unnamed protein product [Parnassius apollo]|uniref:(apollo) hypothetical protein n=1 Tax=Parnassius apollo TaxID=110799 RepID=A0A8S3WU25_PARAO|nr:unnamed protein product [Parnassius apollo]
MYHMKTIVPVEDNIILPKCMYYLRNPNNNIKIDDIEINISDQVMKFLKGAPNNKMVELEQRQYQLLQKLDLLYERIKAISSMCKLDLQPNCISSGETQNAQNSTEIVIVLSPENLPYFLNVFLKNSPGLYITWHIHSSVSNENSLAIKEFFKSYEERYPTAFGGKIKLRLIFKPVSATELRMSSLDVPLVGIVNILRYLCLHYTHVAPYDQNDHCVDGLLDQCHLLENTSGKHKEEIVSKIFSQCKNWIYKNELTIVDLAAYIVIKWQNISKSVPRNWYNKCEKLFT